MDKDPAWFSAAMDSMKGELQTTSAAAQDALWEAALTKEQVKAFKRPSPGEASARKFCSAGLE